MRLESPHFPTKRNPTAEHIRRGFRQVARAGVGNDPFLILLDSSSGAYVQAILQSDGWCVEVRLDADGPHYRLPKAVSESRAAVVFEDFLEQGEDVLDLYPWEDVTDEVDNE